MKKRIIAVTVLIIMALCTTANAVEPRASIVPGLTFQEQLPIAPQLSQVRRMKLMLFSNCGTGII